MESGANMSDNSLMGDNLLPMNFERGPARYQVGDPGRYLKPGLFQKLLEVISNHGIDASEGYFIQLYDAETHSIGRIAGFKSKYAGIEIPTQGSFDIGNMQSDTGHFAICEMTVCVEPEACMQACWIMGDETAAIESGQGYMKIEGNGYSLQLSTPEKEIIREIKKAA